MARLPAWLTIGLVLAPLSALPAQADTGSSTLDCGSITTATAPPGREFAAMAYDSARGRTVMLMRRSLGIAVALLLTAGCAGFGTGGQASAVERYMQTFASVRTQMLASVDAWNRCGSDAQLCRASLNQIEVMTTSFGALYSDDQDGQNARLAVPNCLAVADKEVQAAISNYRQGTSLGFKAYDEGLQADLPVARQMISRGTAHMETANQQIGAAHC